MRAKETTYFCFARLSVSTRCGNSNLSIPKLGEIAAQDAAMADIVIFRVKADLPAETKAWLELWLGQRTCNCAGGVVWPHRIWSGQRVRSYLAGVALRGQMEFLPNRRSRVSPATSVVASLRKGTLGKLFRC